MKLWLNVMKNSKLIWAIHLSALILLLLGVAIDPLLATLVGSSFSIDHAANIGWMRATALILVVGVAISSLFVLLTITLGRRSEKRSRSIRQWLAITSIVAVWFAFISNHAEVAWQGKRFRFASRMDELELIVAPLRDEWPKQDGNLSPLGPFMAYPFGRPKTLVLLQTPQIGSQSVFVSVIERCQMGAIKLQLSGTDGGDWVEWHPKFSQPKSFVGGLADTHQLCASTSLGRGWFLVRYQA